MVVQGWLFKNVQYNNAIYHPKIGIELQLKMVLVFRYLCILLRAENLVTCNVVSGCSYFIVFTL